MKKLYDELKKLSREDVLAMHMPGHKRNLEEFDYLSELGGSFDITEIDGFDNLHDPHGLIGDVCARAASLWGSKKTFLSVNGSTGAVFAALFACIRRGEGLLIARNSHKSVFNAAEISGADTEFVYPVLNDEFGIAGSVCASEVEQALRKKPCKAVVITSPTYEGVVSDVSAIAEKVHAAGAVLIVDEAHGAHLGLSDRFPASSIGSGADIVISGIHKTLPTLTQTAFLHVCSDRVDMARVGKYFSCFVSSSPSYVLMSSVDGMLDYMQTKGRARLAELADALEEFYYKSRGLRLLRVCGAEGKALSGIFEKDSSKIYIDCINCDFCGFELKERLRKEFGIEVEYATPAGVLCIASAGDDACSLNRLYQALKAIDTRAVPAEKKAERMLTSAFPKCERVLSFSECANLSARFEPYRNAVGKIAAESVRVYPPAIPAIVAGERFTQDCATYLSAMKAAGAQIISDSGSVDGLSVLDISE